MHDAGQFRPEVDYEESGDEGEECERLDKTGMLPELLPGEAVEIDQVKGPGDQRPCLLPIP